MFKVVDLASFNDVLDLYAEPQVKNREEGRESLPGALTGRPTKAKGWERIGKDRRRKEKR